MWFHGTCDTFTLTFTKSFESFRAYAIIISKTFLPLDKSYTMFYWRAIVQIPSTLRNYSLKYVLLCNTRSFALLNAIEILMIDSDSSSSGLSESISFKSFWIHLRMVGLSRGKSRNPGILESCGILWNPVEFYGILWNLVESYGIGRNPREFYRILRFSV